MMKSSRFYWSLQAITSAIWPRIKITFTFSFISYIQECKRVWFITTPWCEEKAFRLQFYYRIIGGFSLTWTEFSNISFIICFKALHAFFPTVWILKIHIELLIVPFGCWMFIFFFFFFNRLELLMKYQKRLGDFFLLKNADKAFL